MAAISFCKWCPGCVYTISHLHSDDVSDGKLIWKMFTTYFKIFSQDQLRNSANIVAYFIYFTSLSVILLYWQSRRQCAVQRISVLRHLQVFASLILHSQNYEEVIYNLETASGSILNLLFSCFIFLLVVVIQKSKLRIIQHLSPNMTSLINSVLEVLR